MGENWTEEDIPDLSGRVAVVTGGNGGLGLETVRALATHGAHVVMAARNLEKATSACRAIEDAHPGARIEIVPLDLADLSSVAAAATTIAAHERVDLLVNNAGIMGVPERRTVQGIELQFGTNHVGHFALTASLMPLLLAAPAARVVTVTSVARHVGRPVRRDRDLDAGRYDPWGSYGRSKLANLLFAVELHRRLATAHAPVASLAAHPGLTNSELQATSVVESGGGLSQRFWHLLARTSGMTTREGAAPQLRAATDPQAASGELYGPRWLVRGDAVRLPLVRAAMDRGEGRELWDVSEELAGATFDVAALVAAARRDRGEV
ncbi:oxidoreductase [Actinomarinicola tropica]|uniref:SDR family NAD(P)-dependent oxidoreductase n=1 Tax=Actinomarinicola tropica TaxID=2789776 RepID=A0A5Q2RFR1_9ACTN|nr:oxidoreductase [Actinomarinicola tropica]QGG95669.1 SDR family NAD(P)-dependent oxidoreductase [Actinomarinicola tropica]